MTRVSVLSKKLCVNCGFSLHSALCPPTAHRRSHVCRSYTLLWSATLPCDQSSQLRNLPAQLPSPTLHPDKITPSTKPTVRRTTKPEPPFCVALCVCPIHTYWRHCLGRTWQIWLSPLDFTHLGCIDGSVALYKHTWASLWL